MDSSAIAESRQTSLAVLASEINHHHQAAELEREEVDQFIQSANWLEASA